MLDLIVVCSSEFDIVLLKIEYTLLDSFVIMNTTQQMLVLLNLAVFFVYKRTAVTAIIVSARDMTPKERRTYGRK